MKEQPVFPRRVSLKAFEHRTGSPVFRDVEDQVREIVESVRSGGEARVRQLAQRFDNLSR